MKPGTSYIVCFETIHTSNDDNEESSNSNSPNSEDCHETRTLNPKSEISASALQFPYTEVLISIVVSASISACLAVMCCYLMPKLHKKGKNPISNQAQSQDHLVEVNLKDENDNNKSHHHLKNHDVENSLGEPVELIKR